jgi:hypothetical protein
VTFFVSVQWVFDSIANLKLEDPLVYGMLSAETAQESNDEQTDVVSARGTGNAVDANDEIEVVVAEPAEEPKNGLSSAEVNEESKDNDADAVSAEAAEETKCEGANDH